MGCDGGTIPTRDELVKTKKRKVETAKDVKQAAKWNNCRLSQLPLQKPIVADLLGFLYNKEAFIEFLLDRAKYETGPDYAKSLKDVKEVSLVANPSFLSSTDSSSSSSSKSSSTNSVANGGMNVVNRSPWICPITGLEMNGSFKFYFLFSCGCAFSERAYKKMMNSSKANSSSSSNLSLTSKCLSCEKPFDPTQDLILLNPNSNEEVELNREKAKRRKELKKSQKQQQKQKEKESTSTSTSKSESELSKSSGNSKNEQEIKVQTSKERLASSEKRKSFVSEINNKDGRRGGGEGIGREKKLKTEKDNKTLPSALAASSSSELQSDSTKSDVYKSLFNTCDKAKNQTKGHWVTFNPQYF